MTSQHDQTGRQEQQHHQAGSSGQQGHGNGSGNGNGSAAGNTEKSSTGGRGFAGMDRERQREIASQGGRAAHASGNAHQFTSEEARAAGSKRHANNASRTASTDGDKTSNTRGSNGA
jgi:hypothetical protein